MPTLCLDHPRVWRARKRAGTRTRASARTHSIVRKCGALGARAHMRSLSCIDSRKCRHTHHAYIYLHKSRTLPLSGGSLGHKPFITLGLSLSGVPQLLTQTRGGVLRTHTLRLANGHATQSNDNGTLQPVLRAEEFSAAHNVLCCAQGSPPGTEISALQHTKKMSSGVKV